MGGRIAILRALGNAMMVCVVHALDVERYRLTYGGFLLFALTAMAVFISLVIARFLRHSPGVFSNGPNRAKHESAARSHGV